MARKMKSKTTTTRPILALEDRSSAAGVNAWDSDDEIEIRFSLTALGEAVVSERDRRSPTFRGFGPCGRIVA